MSHNLVKLKFNTKEYTIYNLARVFYNKICNHDPTSKQQWSRFYNRTDPRKHQHWEAFEKLYEVVKDDSHFNMRWYVKSQIIHLGKNKTIWPHQLLTQKAMRNYFEYIQNRKIVVDSDKIEDIRYALTQDKKLFQEWTDDHPGQDYNDFFGNIPDGLIMSDGVYYAIQGMLSLFFLSISKTFMGMYKDLDIDIQEEIASRGKLLVTRDKIRTNEKLKIFAKKTFEDEALL